MRACAAFLTGVEGWHNVNQVAKNTFVLKKIERTTLFLEHKAAAFNPIYRAKQGTGPFKQEIVSLLTC